MKQNSRTQKAFLNVSSSFIYQMIKTILTFITRTIFIYCLSKESLGLNELFTNILSMLSLAELGFGTAINFSLYKPLAENDKEKISALMSFYKKTYSIIGFIVALLGIMLLPFLKYFISNLNEINNVYIIYFVYLANTVSTYYISYKETLINADQKGYKLLKINILFLILLNISQIIVLIIFKSFIIYLLSQFVVQLIQRIATNAYITKQYKEINFNSTAKLTQNDFKIIKKNVKAMIYHKIGDYCINGTDNLIISAFINITTVGLYSNYLTIVTFISTFANLIFNNITSSLGNLIATDTSEKRYIIFTRLNFIGFIIFGFSSSVLINIFNDFITLWVGKDYCFNNLIMLIIVVNFYVTGMRIAPYTIKSASGMYDIDKYAPLIQSLINLAVSIILVKYIGILGVILGTLISSLLIPSWQRPYIVYKYILDKPFSKYVYSYLKCILVLIPIIGISFILNMFIPFTNGYLLLVCKLIIVSIIYVIVIYIVYRKNDEFNYFLNMIRSILNRRKNE